MELKPTIIMVLNLSNCKKLALKKHFSKNASDTYTFSKHKLQVNCKHDSDIFSNAFLNHLKTCFTS